MLQFRKAQVFSLRAEKSLVYHLQDAAKGLKTILQCWKITHISSYQLILVLNPNFKQLPPQGFWTHAQLKQKQSFLKRISFSLFLIERIWSCLEQMIEREPFLLFKLIAGIIVELFSRLLFLQFSSSILDNHKESMSHHRRNRCIWLLLYIRLSF